MRRRPSELERIEARENDPWFPDTQPWSWLLIVVLGLIVLLIGGGIIGFLVFLGGLVAYSSQSSPRCAMPHRPVQAAPPWAMAASSRIALVAPGEAARFVSRFLSVPCSMAPSRAAAPIPCSASGPAPGPTGNPWVTGSFGRSVGRVSGPFAPTFARGADAVGCGLTPAPGAPPAIGWPPSGTAC